MDKSLLTFDESTHQYCYEGKPVISVTQVLKYITDEKYQSIPGKIMDAAADKGDDVHAAIHLFNETDMIDVAPENKGYLDGYLKFKSDFGHKPINNEYIVYSELGYAGRFDNIGFVDNELTLVDYKTTAELNKKLVGIQLSAYRQALKEEEIIIDRGLLLQLKKDGKYKSIFYTGEELDKYFEMFKTLLQAYKIKKYVLGGNI